MRPVDATLATPKPGNLQHRRVEDKKKKSNASKEQVLLKTVDINVHMKRRGNTPSQGNVTVPKQHITYNEVLLLQYAIDPMQPDKTMSPGFMISQRLLDVFGKEVQVSRCRVDQLSSKPTVNFSPSQSRPVPKLQVRVVEMAHCTPQIEAVIDTYLRGEDIHHKMLLLVPELNDVRKHVIDEKKRLKLEAILSRLWSLGGASSLRVPFNSASYPTEAAAMVEQVVETALLRIKATFNTYGNRRYSALAPCPEPLKPTLQKIPANVSAYKRGRYFKTCKKTSQQQAPPNESGAYKPPRFQYRSHHKDAAFVYINKAKGTSCTSGGKRAEAEILTIDGNYEVVQISEDDQEKRLEVLDKVSSRCQRSTIKPTGWVFEQAGVHCNVMDKDKHQHFVFYRHYDVPFAVRRTQHRVGTVNEIVPRPVPPSPPPGIVDVLNLDSHKYADSTSSSAPFAGFGRLERAILDVGDHTRCTRKALPCALSSLIKYTYEGKLDHTNSTKKLTANKNLSTEKEEAKYWKDFRYLAPQSDVELTKMSYLPDEGLEDAPFVPKGLGKQVDDLSGQEHFMAGIVDFHIKTAHTQRARLLTPLNHAVSDLSPLETEASKPAMILFEVPRATGPALPLNWLPNQSEPAPPAPLQWYAEPHVPIIARKVHPALKGSCLSGAEELPTLFAAVQPPQPPRTPTPVSEQLAPRRKGMKFKNELEEEKRLVPKWYYVKYVPILRANATHSYRMLESIIKKFKYEFEQLEAAEAFDEYRNHRVETLRNEFFDRVGENVSFVETDYKNALEKTRSFLEHTIYHAKMDVGGATGERAKGHVSFHPHIAIDAGSGFNPDSCVSQDELVRRIATFRDIYMDLLDLNRMRKVNREAIRKIVKKFDKVSGDSNQESFMAEVDMNEFCKSEDLTRVEQQLLDAVRRLYAKTTPGELEFQKFRESTIVTRQRKLKSQQKRAIFSDFREPIIFSAAIVTVFLFMYMFVQPQFTPNPAENWKGYVVILALLVGVILIAVYNKPADVCLTSVNILFLTLNIISADEAFAGFANQGVIANGILLPFARALSVAGGAELCLMKCLGMPKNILSAQVRMCAVVAVLSSVLNNTPIVVMMIPILRNWCSRLNMSVSKFMLPMSFAIMLGGTCSIVGSSANLVTIGMASSYHGKFPLGQQPVYQRPGFWQPALVGLPVCLVGILWMVIVSVKLLPERIPAVGQDKKMERSMGAGSLAKLMTPAAFQSTAKFDVMFKLLGNLHGMRVEESGITRLGSTVKFIVNTEDISKNARIEEPPLDGPWMYTIKEGDVAVFNCSSQQVNTVRQAQGLEIYNKHLKKLAGERRSRALIEATVSSDSALLGKTLLDMDMRRTQNVCCIGIASQDVFDDRDTTDVAKMCENFKRQEIVEGDVLLFEADKKQALYKWAKESWFSSMVVIENSAPPMRDTRNMIITMGSLLLLVILTSSEMIDIVTLGFIIVASFIALGVITNKEAWASVKGDVLLTIAASFGIGQAMSNSGIAVWIGTIITNVCGGSHIGVLSMVYTFTVTLGMVLNNASVAVLVYPVAYSACVETSGLDPEIVVLLIIMGAGLSFTTPMSYQTNQLVQAPGGYLFGDYVRFGGSLQIATGIASVSFLYTFGQTGLIKMYY